MSMPRPRKNRSRAPLGRRRRGAIILLVAFLMVVLFIGVAFSVDVAHIQLTKTQLRVSTDLANRAGTEALARTKSKDAATLVAKQIARANPVASRPLVLDDSQFVFGNVGKDANDNVVFSPNGTPLNAMRIDSAMSSRAGGGAVPLFFGGMLGTKEFSPQLTSVVTNQGQAKRDIAAVIDITGSMGTRTATGTRFTDLLAAFDALVVALNETDDDEKLGLATYSTSAAVDLPLSHGYPAAVNKLQQKRPNGNTNIYSGIEAGRVILNGASRRADTEKVMLLMTDGLHNTGPSPVLAAQNAKNDKIRIITVTFDTLDGIPLMQQVAQITGGQHYHAPTIAELRTIFQNVGLGTDGLQFIDP